MKKFAPVLAVLGIIIIGVVAFSLMRNTAEAPELPSPQATTTEGTATSSAQSQGSPIGVGAPTGQVTKVMKAYVNPSWDIRLRYDPEWNLTPADDLVTIGSVSADFMVSKEKTLAKPARLESTIVTRTILGSPVEVTRFENPNETYEFYEYFKLRVNGNEYYFKISSHIDPNPKVEEFIKSISTN